MPHGPDPLRAIVVGIYGNRGQKLARALFELPNFVKVVGGVDVSPVQPPSIPSELPVFPSVEQALSNLSFDVAILATPTGYHFEQVQLLIGSGIHVIKEKPFETNLDRARRLVNLADKSNLSVYVLTQRAYYPTYTLAKNCGNAFNHFALRCSFRLMLDGLIRDGGVFPNLRLGELFLTWVITPSI